MRLPLSASRSSSGKGTTPFPEHPCPCSAIGPKRRAPQAAQTEIRGTWCPPPLRGLSKSKPPPFAFATSWSPNLYRDHALGLSLSPAGLSTHALPFGADDLTTQAGGFAAPASPSQVSTFTFLPYLQTSHSLTLPPHPLRPALYENLS